MTDDKPDMNTLIRAGKPPKPDIFAKYHIEDTQQTPQTGTTDPKDDDQ